MGKNVKPCDGDEDSDEDQDDGVDDGDGDADVHDSEFYSHIGYIRDMLFLLAAAENGTSSNYKNATYPHKLRLN